MTKPSFRFTPQVETLDIRANPGGRVGGGGDIFTGSNAIIGELQTFEVVNPHGVWVGEVIDGGRTGIGGEF